MRVALCWSCMLFVAALAAACEVVQDDRDPLTDCLSYRAALCERYADCMEKPDGWHLSCLQQQDKAGGTCADLAVNNVCMRTRSEQWAECADSLPTTNCDKVCKSTGDGWSCNAPCLFVCSTRNPGLRN